MTNKKLKPLPCPFCGGKNIWVYSSMRTDELWMNNKYAQCNGCYSKSHEFSTEEKAIKAWNKRV